MFLILKRVFCKRRLALEEENRGLVASLDLRNREVSTLKTEVELLRNKISDLEIVLKIYREEG